MIDYDGRSFLACPAPARDAPTAQYHQRERVVWAEFAGGHVDRGSLTGTCRTDGSFEATYCMVTDSGDVIAGRTFSFPEVLADGRIRLVERWERYGPHASTGVSYLEEVAAQPHLGTHEV
jgi:hypothetical protein